MSNGRSERLFSQLKLIIIQIGVIVSVKMHWMICYEYLLKGHHLLSGIRQTQFNCGGTIRAVDFLAKITEIITDMMHAVVSRQRRT